ncbi:hypothetical protein TNCV_3016631 [Trichonephila clavipes]|nr:hypothetical protein TNCV_3016631 [Trichonephila clavipes]
MSSTSIDLEKGFIGLELACPFHKPKVVGSTPAGGRGSRVVKVSDRGWPCHEFEPSATNDPRCREAMHVEYVESSNFLPLVWRAVLKLTNVDRSAVIKRLRSTALNSRQAACLLVRLVEGEKRWEAPDHPQGVLPQNWGVTEQNHTVTSMVLKVTSNDRRKNLALRGP